MSMFGSRKGGGGFFGPDMMSRFARAQALTQGDYGAAAGITADMQRNSIMRERAEREQAEALQQELSLRSSLEMEGYPSHVIDGIMADPKQVSALMVSKYQTRQGGAEGLTVGGIDPTTGQLRTQTSAGWHNGDYFGASNGSGAPERLYQGEKVMPVAPGGYLGVYGGPQASAGGMGGGTPPAPPAAAAPSASPRPGTVEDGYRFKGGNPADPNAWEPVGGAGPAVASRTFRRPSGLFGR